MAEGKKSVLLYCDLIHTVEKMDDVTAGLFFKHYLRYINDENPKTENVIVDISFESVKQNLKRDLQKWEKRSENSRLNGLKGGRPKTQRTQSVNPEPKEPVTDTVNVNVNDNKGIEDFKIEFCNVYPKAGNPFEILAAIQTLPKEEQIKAIEYVPTYVKNTEKTYYKTPINYLNSYCWNDKDNIKTKITYE